MAEEKKSKDGQLAAQEQDTSGQFVQKSKSDFSGDYRKRDTYHRSSVRKSHHRKRYKKEYQSRYSDRYRQDSNSPYDRQDARKDIHKNSEEKDTFNSHDSVFQGKGSSEFKESDTSGFPNSRKLDRKKKQAEKASDKAVKARGKLPQKKEYTLKRVFDEETGQAKYVVATLEVEKHFQKDRSSKSVLLRVQHEGSNVLHNKISQTEQDNVGVESVHQTEQKAEELFGFVKRQYRGKRYRQQKKLQKLEKKAFQKEVNFRYQKFLEENPKLQQKATQKRLQKQRIKKEYQKAMRNRSSAKMAKKAVGKTANTTVSVARKLQEIAARHAGTLVTIGIFAVLLIIIMTAVSSCGAMFVGTESMVLSASYLSQPAQIDATDLAFTEKEMRLQSEIDRIETNYPDYDEYTYNLGVIGHDPFTLIGYLSAVHTEFTASEVETELRQLFDQMYTLNLTPNTETRTRTVTKTGTHTVTDPVTGATSSESYTYEEEEEYEVSILRVVLTVIPLETIINEKMDAEQREIYETYAETKGLLQEFASPLDLYWYNYISSYYGYRKNPNTGNEELHRGIDIAVPTGTTVYAAHDGIITTASYDSYYGNYVVIEKNEYATKYAHMDTLSVSAGQTIGKGGVIGTTGNTGSSTGSHLHIECLYNGEYYNPLFYFDAGTNTLYGETPGTGGGGNGTAIPPDSYDDATVQALMEEAAKYLGYTYVWGGSSPATSFDCSGFVCWSFTNSGVHNLPRTTAQGIYEQCTPVSASEAKAGDIIFFTGTYNSAGAVSHVGIYCGNGVMIHCGDPISYASVNSSYWQSHFYSYGRLN